MLKVLGNYKTFGISMRKVTSLKKPGAQQPAMTPHYQLVATPDMTVLWRIFPNWA
jgi:hypothetical protein